MEDLTVCESMMLAPQLRFQKLKSIQLKFSLHKHPMRRSIEPLARSLKHSLSIAHSNRKRPIERVYTLISILIREVRAEDAALEALLTFETLGS